MPKLTVCGGGNAAHVLVALSGQANWDVDIYTMLPDETERLKAGIVDQGYIAAQDGEQTYHGSPRQISTDPAAVIPGSELILLALPAFAHAGVLSGIAGHIDPQTTVGALPSRGGFDLQVANLLDVNGLSLCIFGLQTLPWACRISRYGQQATILGTKATVDIAVTPPDHAAHVLTQLAFIPNVAFTPAESMLALTLSNTGQLIHPGIMYGLCSGRENGIYDEANIPLFYQGIDDFTADVLQQLSDEIQMMTQRIAALAPQFQPSAVRTLSDWLYRAYNDFIADRSSLKSSFVTNAAYAGLRFPMRRLSDGQFMVDFTARYLSEDIPYGLVAVRGIAELVKVETPMIDRIINWAQGLLGRVYLEDGRLKGQDVMTSRAPQAFGILTLHELLTYTASRI